MELTRSNLKKLHMMTQKALPKKFGQSKKANKKFLAKLFGMFSNSLFFNLNVDTREEKIIRKSGKLI